MRIFSCLLLFVLLYSCNPQTDDRLKTYFTTGDSATIKTGGVQLVEITTPKGTFKVWTKRFGNNPKIKLLLLHGGPGGSHESFECFESFLPREGIEFIYYDQLGSYQSDAPADSSLWTTERFVDEVEQVRKALHLDKNNFYLLGHSWGGILAMEYALKYQENLKGLIISNMMSSCPAYAAYNKNVLQKQMDPKIVDSILYFEKTNTTANPKYMELLINYYYNKHICQTIPYPDALNRMFAHLNTSLYTIMQGPSEFGVSGRLANWDRTNDLQQIKVPTLVIRGMEDTMDPAFMKMMSEKLPNGSLVTCTRGSHCSMWDDQANYFNGLLEFLKK